MLHEGATAEIAGKQFAKRMGRLWKRGVDWKTPDADWSDQVSDLLVRAGEIPPTAGFGPGDITVLGRHRESVISALVLTPARMGEDTVVLLRHLAVLPNWRGKGVGTVTLNHARASTKALVDATIGACAPETAAFFAAAGFTVLSVGEHLPFSYGREAAARTGLGGTRPCAMFRHW